MNNTNCNCKPIKKKSEGCWILLHLASCNRKTKVNISSLNGGIPSKKEESKEEIKEEIKEKEIKPIFGKNAYKDWLF